MRDQELDHLVRRVRELFDLDEAMDLKRMSQEAIRNWETRAELERQMSRRGLGWVSPELRKMLQDAKRFSVAAGGTNSPVDLLYDALDDGLVMPHPRNNQLYTTTPKGEKAISDWKYEKGRT